MKTYLDWSAYQDAGMGDAYADIPKHGGNFAKAVAVCINSRQCETVGKQVMCPSFQVSGNAHLSTGGRVRLLKAALSSDLTQEALRDPTLAEAMELCVSCKGCKRECEANVDMALIKVEYLAQRVAREGLRLRDRLFAHTPHWLHRAPWLKPLIRWRNRSSLLARWSERWIGLSAKRQLPEPAPRPFTFSDASRPTAHVPTDGRPEVVLLVDTFTHHFEPEIAEAAVAVLRTGGYSVQVAKPEATSPEPARPLCCGRTYLVHGLLDEARAEVRRLSEVLLPHLEPVYDLLIKSARKARTTMFRLVLSLRSQFFQRRRDFSSQPKDRSTTHLLGKTEKVWSSLRFTTSTVAPMMSFTAAAKGSPV